MKKVLTGLAILLATSLLLSACNNQSEEEKDQAMEQALALGLLNQANTKEKSDPAPEEMSVAEVIAKYTSGATQSELLQTCNGFSEKYLESEEAKTGIGEACQNKETFPASFEGALENETSALSDGLSTRPGCWCWDSINGGLHLVFYHWDYLTTAFICVSYENTAQWYSCGVLY